MKLKPVRCLSWLEFSERGSAHFTSILSTSMGHRAHLIVLFYIVFIIDGYGGSKPIVRTHAPLSAVEQARQTSTQSSDEENLNIIWRVQSGDSNLQDCADPAAKTIEEKLAETFTKRSAEVAMELLSTFQKISVEKKIEYFVGAGAAFGFHCIGGKLPFDDDLDIFVAQEHWDLLKTSLDELRSSPKQI